MPLFKKTTKEKIKAVAPVAPVLVSAPRSLGDVSSILIRPRVTEKSASGHEKGVYVFDVRSDANAVLVAEAVKTFFKVTPRKVNVVAVPSKAVVVRGRRGVKAGGKKAYVFLKKGDKIELV